MPDHRKEIRIALVLYGGISLAVYMNGVVQELLRFVRARRTTGPDQNDPYGRLLDLINGEAVIDVIAGTSAGGINGVFLAKALACGVGLSALPPLWKERADIANLAQYQKGEEAEGLLSGEYFLEKLEEIYRRLDQEAKNPLAVELAETNPVIDLFVTTTDLRGHVWQDVDSRRNKIWGRDHAHYFHVKKRSRHKDGKRGYDHNEFAGPGEHLARVCRATAAIPGVFAPVDFDMSRVHPDNRHDPRKAVWMHDGGVVDNRPFRKVIETICNRSAEGPVDRLLLYVEPDPEGSGLSSKSAKARHMAKPEALDSVTGLLSSSMYQSIHQHIRALKEYNHRLEDFQAVRKKLDQIQTPLSPDNPAYATYLQLRLQQVADTLAAELEAGVLAAYPDRAQQAADAGQHLAGAVRATAEQEIPLLVEEVDIPFYRRLFYHLIEHFTPLHDAGKAVGAEEDQIWSVLEDLRQRFWQWSHPGAPDANPALESVDPALFAAVAADPKRAPDLLPCLRSTVRAWRGEVDLSLVSHILQVSFGAAERFDLDSVAAIYAAKDLILLPLSLSGLGERDRIELYRVSPFDTPDGPSGEDKVTGTGLLHFAAFLDEKWRANDILWGRLDTADILTDIIGRKADLEWTDETITEIRRELYRRIIAEERAAIDIKALTDWILQRAADRGSSDLTSTERERFRNLVTGMAAVSRGQEEAAMDEALRQVAAGLQLDDDAILRLAELSDFQSFLMEKHKVGQETWHTERVQPAVANAAVDLAHNALAVFQPYVDNIPFKPIQKVTGWLSGAVSFLRTQVRRFLPGKKTQEPVQTIIDGLWKQHRVLVSALLSAAAAVLAWLQSIPLIGQALLVAALLLLAPGLIRWAIRQVRERSYLLPGLITALGFSTASWSGITVAGARLKWISYPQPSADWLKPWMSDPGTRLTELAQNGSYVTVFGLVWMAWVWYRSRRKAQQPAQSRTDKAA